MSDVEIKHKNTEGTAVVSQAAFDETWKAKGWRLVDRSKSAARTDTHTGTTETGEQHNG